MRVVIEINCDNSAFSDDSEISRILVNLGNSLRGITINKDCGFDYIPISDINGNKVGELKIVN